MAGGTFTTYSKLRPGAYVNFQAVPRPTQTVGDRGIVAIPLPLSWGVQGAIIDVSSEDFFNGRTLSNLGLSTTSPGAKLLRAALSYAYQAKVYRLNVAGTAATGTLGSLTVTAKYTGVFGNSISVAIIAKGALFDVQTFAAGAVVDTQTVAEIAELVANDYVAFTGSGDLTANPGVTLAGGADGAVAEATAYPAFFSLLKTTRYQAVVIPTTDAAVKETAAAFIRSQRENEGRYVQAVIAGYDADYEGVINVVNGATIGEEDFQPEEFVAVVAGLTAGARITDSNTGALIRGATAIIGELDNAGIIAALQSGQFVLSTRQDGGVQVEKDVNSLHTFMPTHSDVFSKNRVIRLLDEIGQTVRGKWETSYSGKVNRDATGLATFRADIVSYLATLQDAGAITDFSGAADVAVLPGEAIDTVVCNIAIRVVDSMERLYFTVNILS